MWIAIASVLLFLISRLQEFAVNLVEREFNLTFRRAQQQLGQAAEAILRAGSFAKIEHLLVNAPVQTLGLASAAVLRDEGGALYRRPERGRVGTARHGSVRSASPGAGRPDRGTAAAHRRRRCRQDPASLGS